MTGAGSSGSGPLGLILALWLVPLAAMAWAGLLTAQVGRLSLPVAAVAGALALAVVAAAAVSRHDGSSRRLHWADVAALALVAFAAWRLGPAATPWPAFLDASWYVNAGARIARDGRLHFDPLTLQAAGEGTAARQQLVTTFLDQVQAGLAVPADPTQGFHDVVFAVPDVAEAETTPYHPPFFSTWVALWARMRGALHAGGAVLPWSVAYLLAVAALARMAFGPVAALAAVALIAVGPAYAYYGRTPFAEMAAGALVMAGLVALTAVAARIGSRPGMAFDETDGARPLLAALGGLGIGLAALVKAEAVLLVPVVLLWWLLARRRAGGATEGLALLAGLAVPLANAAVLAISTTGLYVALNSGGVLALAQPLLQSLLPSLAVAAVLAAALAAAFVFVWHRRGRRDGDADLGGVLRRGAAVAVLVALALIMVRSWLASAGGPPPVAAVLSWLVTPLGLWAGAAGLAMALERGRARTGPLIAVALVAVPVVLLAPAITETLSPLYTARRLVPFALPVVAIFAGGLVAQVVAWWSTYGTGLAGRGSDGRAGEDAGRIAERANRGAGSSRSGSTNRHPDRQMSVREGRAYVLAALVGTALVLFSLFVTARPFYRVRSFSGGAALAKELAGYGGSDDIFLFASILDGSAAGRMAAPLWTLEGRETAVIGPVHADLTPLSRAVDGWISEGRHVLLLADAVQDPPEIPGYDASYIDQESIVTRALAPASVLPATWRPLEISVAVYELLPIETRERDSR